MAEGQICVRNLPSARSAQKFCVGNPSPATAADVSFGLGPASPTAGSRRRARADNCGHCTGWRFLAGVDRPFARSATVPGLEGESGQGSCQLRTLGNPVFSFQLPNLSCSPSILLALASPATMPFLIEAKNFWGHKNVSLLWC